MTEEFKKYKLEQISFDELFGELDSMRMEALKSENPILLKMIEEIGEQMQEIEKGRMEEKEEAEAA